MAVEVEGSERPLTPEARLDLGRALEERQDHGRDGDLDQHRAPEGSHVGDRGLAPPGRRVLLLCAERSIRCAERSLLCAERVCHDPSTTGPRGTQKL